MPSSKVEFGLLLHTRHLIRADQAASPVEELWQTAAQAEELGFSHVWVGDSPRLSLLDRAHADCLTLMAALAARTSRIKIGTVPLIVALRNPVLLAHALATLDVISSGRILIGASSGHQYPYAEREFAACGVPFRQKAGRLNESIALIRRLWTEGPFSFDGKYYRFDEIGIEPKPVQKSIPIWLAAGDNENALRRVARLGDGWFTVAHSVEEFIARRRKIDCYAKEYGRRGTAIPAALFATFHLGAGAGGASAQDEGWSLAEKYFRQPRAKLSHLTPFFGTPEECARELRPYVDGGLTAIVARVISHEPVAQMRLLLDELKPRLSARR
ncbi:MAG TPA: LLM class flavin-dependent oxidoreductase [Candidatus Binatia bacterium]|jgi:probable F420-dependent oxidoreductase